MDALHIPETATETYLEHLADNITRQIERSQNKKVRAHLDLMLENVYARLQEKRRESQKFPQRDDDDDIEVLELTDEFEEEGAAEAAEAPRPGQPNEEVGEQEDVLLLTELIEEEGQLAAADDDFSTQEHLVMKDRLRAVMQKVQERKSRTPEEDDGVVLADVMREISTEEPIDSDELSSDQENKVKERLKRILGAVQAKNSPSSDDALTDDDITQTLTRKYRGSIDSWDDVPVEDQEEGTPEQTTGVVAAKTFQPLSKDEQFIDICKKISQGHSIELFQSMPLSDREQDILNAMTSQLNSYKGLKKQQVFEMQHLTARSIHELDLIFKTYHIQGYLKAELNNVYNRLLNIRGRFSMLLN